MSRHAGMTALLSFLLVLSTLMFVTGATLEKHRAHPGSESTLTRGNTDSDQHAQADGDSGEHAGSSESHREGDSLFGVDTESTALTILGASLSLALAAAVLTWRRRGLMAGAALFALVFATLDTHELIHQVHEHAALIATLAGLTLLLHLAAAGTGALGAANGRRSST